MRKKAMPKLIYALIILAVLLSGAQCGKTVMRDGVRVSAERAQQMDMMEAEQAMQDENYDEAISIYKGFLTEFPDSGRVPEVTAELGQAYYKKEDCPTARMYFKDVIENYPGHPAVADAGWGLALCAYRNDNCEAVMQYALAYRDEARDRRWDQMTLLAAKCAMEQDRPKEAVELIGEEQREGYDDELKEIAGKNADLLVEKLTEDELLELAAEHKREYPGDLALVTLANRALEHEDYELASEYAERLKDEHPRSIYEDQYDIINSRVARWSQVKPGKIGLLLPLSGPLAKFGEQALKGAMLAASVFGEGQPFYPAQLIIKDTGSEFEWVEGMIEDLVNDEHVIAIVGPMKTGVAEKAALKAQQLGVPIVTLSPGEDLPDLGDMVYQNCLTKRDQVEVLAEYAVNEMGMKKFGVLYPNDDYGNDFFGLFARSVAERGGEIKATSFYELTETDFKSQIKWLKSMKEDHEYEGLFIPDSWVRVAMIAPQLRYYKLTDFALLGVNSWHDPSILRQTQPEDVEGAVFVDGIAPEANRPSFNSFRRNYKADFGEEPGLIEAQAYEAVDLLLHQIRTYYIRDRAQLKQSLDHVVDYPGALGLTTVLDNGKWEKPVYLFKISEGEIRMVYQM